MPTDCLDSIPPTCFFLSLLLQNQRISGSPISTSLPWVTGEEAAGSRPPPPAAHSSSGCGRGFHFQVAESTQLLQPHTGAFTGFWAQQFSWQLQQDSSKQEANRSSGQHCAAWEYAAGTTGETSGLLRGTHIDWQGDGRRLPAKKCTCETGVKGQPYPEASYDSWKGKEAV